MKPVAIFEYQLLNNTKGGDIVLDSFAGSGTTVIAAEKNGRVAHLMELDPRYCDVIIKRWQDFTGKAATLEGDGRTFNEIAGVVSSDDPANTDPTAEPNHP
jgi:DNA modification methylase